MKDSWWGIFVLLGSLALGTNVFFGLRTGRIHTKIGLVRNHSRSYWFWVVLYSAATILGLVLSYVLLFNLRRA